MRLSNRGLLRRQINFKGGTGLAEIQDKTLTCKDCGNSFVFTTGEQEFYKEKGFENEPVRCGQCRNARKNTQGGRGGSSQQKSFRPLVEVTCESCGCLTKVPFKPTQGKPVFCRDCYDKDKTTG